MSWTGPAGLVLALVGLVGGVALGLGLRSSPPRPAPPVASIDPMAPAVPPAPAPNPALAPAPADSAARRAAIEADIAAEQARLDSLRQARATAEAELANLRQSRAAAEAELAGLRRDLAAGRRELAAAQPPAPPQQLGAPPRPLRLPETVATAAPGQPRVFIHLRAGSTAAANAAAELAPQLREAGFDLGEARVVTATPSQRVVRYFHGEDAPAAARLAGRLGRGWAIQDFRNFEPAPSLGTLEIWLPDR
ncbi:hypothetical protein [Belnapia moabensis]|uniref:hypothetical protein n=1 Tax=Belnapia moabensis TaxID=365533 RepID=UPI0006946205|nr:hypothetical protein [Belnapia moabensis]